MDIKAPWDKYHQLAGMADDACDTLLLRRSLRLIAPSGLPNEFRTTHVEPLLSAEDCDKIAGQIPPGSTHKWQTFRTEHSLDPALRGVNASSVGIPVRAHLIRHDVLPNHSPFAHDPDARQ